jgi:DNA relaxase NicK
LDIALTTWKREVSHDMVVESHAAGLFRGTCGGRPPELQQITSSDPMAGRTCYVGMRTGEKFFRGYEKGLEMRGQQGRAGLGLTHIDGFPVEDIYRCEIELKPKSTVVPWEAIERRDQYFAGSYPFLGKLLPGVEADILMRRPERAPQTSLKVALANARIQFGSTLYTACSAYGGDFGRVWSEIVGSCHNADLLAAGVLQVEHD